MSDPYEVIEYKGFKIKVYQDEDPGNPRTEWDNLGTMCCFHKRYELGDNSEDWLGRKLSSDEFSGWDGLEKYLIKSEKAAVILPLYLYDHSGITMNTTGFSCQWDSGQVGWIFISRPKILKEYGWKVLSKKRKERIEQYLRNEVETYDQYLRGDVYGYEIESPEGYEVEDGSCWGYYGSDHSKSGLLEQAQSIVDYEVEKRKAIKAAQEAPFDKLPLLINETKYDEVKEVVKRRLKEEPAKYGYQLSLAV